MNIRPKTDREQKLDQLLESALAALKDLHAGYPWRELHIDLDTMLHEAELLGIHLEKQSV